MSLQFHITPSAASRLGILIQEKPAGSFLRISVLGGGCSGYEYNFEFDHAKQADDSCFSVASSPTPVEVVIDAISAPLLTDSTLEYEEEIGKSAFKIINPQASSNCGCGNSFSIKDNVQS